MKGWGPKSRYNNRDGRFYTIRWCPHAQTPTSVASAEGLGVLHYDRDYDALAEHTSLSFPSVWIAPRGSLG
jgi:hypothetical protein